MRRLGSQQVYGTWELLWKRPKNNPTVGFGQPFLIACCLFGLFINQPVSPCQDWPYCDLCPCVFCFFFEARLASPPFNLSCHVILCSKVCHTLLVGPKCLRWFLNLLSLAAIIRRIFIWKRQSAIFCFRSSFCLYLEIPNGAPWGCGLSDLCLYNRAALTYEVFAREPTLALCLLETKYDNFILHNLASKEKKQNKYMTLTLLPKGRGEVYDCEIEPLLFSLQHLALFNGLLPFPKALTLELNNLCWNDSSHSPTVSFRQLNCIIWWCVFEREARLSSNPGRSRPSPCPMAPSASDWALCLLRLLSEKLRWNRCLLMGDRDDFSFSNITPSHPLKISSQTIHPVARLQFQKTKRSLFCHVGPSIINEAQAVNQSGPSAVCQVYLFIFVLVIVVLEPHMFQTGPNITG